GLELEALDSEIAAEDALAGTPRRRGTVQPRVGRKGPQRRWRQQVRECEDVRAAARPADLAAERARPAVVQRQAGDPIDAADQIAAALAAGGGRGFEGDVRHLRGELLDAPGLAVDAAVEPHVMDDAGALQIAAHRRE